MNRASVAAVLARCPLARPAPGGCAWCGAALPPTRRSWCADRCAEAFRANHWWRRARQAAKRRDRRRCVRCGHAPAPRPSARGFASRAGYLAALRAWRAGRPADRLEVNHREPCRGAHDVLGCAHHLENLETLCVACHRAHTRGLS